MELPAANRQFSTSYNHGKEVSGINSNKPYRRYPSCSPEVYRRQASSYSVPSSELIRSSIRRSSSFSVAAQRVAGVFSCFVPRKVRTEEENENFQATFSQGSRSTGYHVSTDSAGTGQESTVLTIAEIFRATSNFSENNIIRQGTYSSIYRGKLGDGTEVAIKSARKLDGQYLSADLRRELEIIQKIEHKNLVRFLAFFKREDKSLTVVEYVSNGTLRKHLDESCGNGLELAQRLNIAIDVAHAITYLHEFKEQPIIHRSIRSSNVLLTDALTAKLGGVGLAGIADGEGSQSEDTQVKGAAGYMDPEYLSTYELTDKSDVYSFGVLLVELVTGRPPIERRPDLDPRPTTKWALHRYRGGEVVVAMDPRIRRSPASVATVEQVMELAEQCVTPARKDRPSMRRCTEALWSIRRDHHHRQDAPAATAAKDRSSEWVQVV
ncbi:hypothetical protein ABZP36_006476 [Zizania latifolia]